MGKRKVGLVLEGGTMRGMYTAGVLDGLMDHGVRVDGILGVSAGGVLWLQPIFRAARARAAL